MLTTIRMATRTTIKKAKKTPQKPTTTLADEQVIVQFEKLIQKWRRKGKVDRFFIHHIHQSNFALGKRFFESVAALSVNISFEAVCLRQNPTTNEVEVYMIKRLPGQSYAGQWHVPGSIFRPGEYPADVAKRLSKLEFKTPIKNTFSFVTDFFVPEQRGWFLTRVYIVELAGEPHATGAWFPVRNLPSRTMPHHKKHIIPSAVRMYNSK